MLTVFLEKKVHHKTKLTLPVFIDGSSELYLGEILLSVKGQTERIGAGPWSKGSVSWQKVTLT